MPHNYKRITEDNNKDCHQEIELMKVFESGITAYHEWAGLRGGQRGDTRNETKFML